MQGTPTFAGKDVCLCEELCTRGCHFGINLETMLLSTEETLYVFPYILLHILHAHELTSHSNRGCRATSGWEDG